MAFARTLLAIKKRGFPRLPHTWTYDLRYKYTIRVPVLFNFLPAKSLDFYKFIRFIG